MLEYFRELWRSCIILTFRDLRSSSKIVLGSTRKYFKGAWEILTLFSGCKGTPTPPPPPSSLSLSLSLSLFLAPGRASSLELIFMVPTKLYCNVRRPINLRDKSDQVVKICDENCLLCVFLIEAYGSRPMQQILITYCILVDSSTVICWTSPFVILGVSGVFCHFYSSFDGKFC